MQHSDQIPEEIQKLIAGFLTESLNAGELQAFHQWITESNENQKVFTSYLSAWYMSGKSPAMAEDETERALLKVKKIRDQGWDRTTKSFWSFWKVAASWLIVFSLGAFCSFLMTRSSNNPITGLSKTKIVAPLGSVTLVDLPDGSKVWLNAGSEITYDPSYGTSERVVRLTGEAYFDVKSDKTKPFQVSTSDVVIKAVGTRFNVKAYDEENNITATLEEGKIILTTPHNPAGKEQVLLKPNEMYTYYKNLEKCEPKRKDTLGVHNGFKPDTEHNLKITPNIRTELVTSWKDKTWIIESQPLGYLIPILERRYDIKIEFESDEIMKYKFTGKIQKETIEQIMEAFALSAPINYAIDKNKIRLSLNRKKQEEYDHYILE